ncbi:indole-3-glycerol phosphate synthase TrpC [Jeotgalibacillus proteolyticus]|uniref:Indole-3-glycerol phosphate synthase n=1 Tax=Jeotgalibacillus proteolyticus TaxID=2082395 RepID=A0A2S5GFK8_9BACL|nr:indole-3-glycerol phosphate synthase TrpC [Jeotgalibacillus proteolyticus]PPA71820.1 indole-3-glycerol phosphate synthase TrpC [Jeotgalibacillus proteolyticus]
MTETILDKILKQKALEVEDIKRDPSLLLTKEGEKTEKVTLKDSLDLRTRLGVIAEIKRASPSKGIINEGIDPVKQARLYESNGASAISVLTDEQFFKGSMEDLTNVANAVSVPVLCKDFIIDGIQIERAQKAGASIILLIVAALEQEALTALFNKAKELGLEVLVEVHDEDELTRALNLGAELIGVNNRNLKTFEVDLEISKRLAAQMPLNEIHFISESGILTEKEAKIASDSGASGVLVGEVLMKSDDAGGLLHSLQVPLQGERS